MCERRAATERTAVCWESFGERTFYSSQDPAPNQITADNSIGDTEEAETGKRRETGNKNEMKMILSVNHLVVLIVSPALYSER